jgi:hypothetical protein
MFLNLEAFSGSQPIPKTFVADALVQSAIRWRSEELREALREAAEMAVFEFFCLLDGVSAIEDGTDKGELELCFIKGDKKTRLNDPRQEELHNLFNGLCSVGTESRAPNPEINPYDSDHATDLRSKLKSSDELDIHHVPDKYFCLRTVSNYDPATAPAIALPKSEHRQIPLQRKE